MILHAVFFLRPLHPSRLNDPSVGNMAPTENRNFRSPNSTFGIANPLAEFGSIRLTKNSYGSRNRSGTFLRNNVELRGVSDGSVMSVWQARWCRRCRFRPVRASYPCPLAGPAHLPVNSNRVAATSSSSEFPVGFKRFHIIFSGHVSRFKTNRTPMLQLIAYTLPETPDADERFPRKSQSLHMRQRCV